MPNQEDNEQQVTRVGQDLKLRTLDEKLDPGTKNTDEYPAAMQVR